MLYNLFKFFPDDSVCMLTDDPSKKRSKKDEKMRLPFKHYISRVPNFSLWFIRSANMKAFLQYCWLPVILVKGIAIVMKEKIGSIFSLNSTGPYLLAAYYLHRITGRPLYVYMFDLWSRQPMNPFQERMAKKFEERILRAADKVFVMSENLADYYREKYSIESEVIRHSYIKDDVKKAGEHVRSVKRQDKFEIVFTGVVNIDTLWINQFRAMLEDLSDKKIRLRLCVPRVRRLADLECENMTVQCLDREEVLRAQRQADVLFLPMFWSKDHSKEIAQTASPSKLGEYLISGVPILALAPRDSYVSEYAARENWALVVNDIDKEKLKEAVLRLKNDLDLRKTLVSNALKAAVYHDAELQSNKLQKDILP